MTDQTSAQDYRAWHYGPNGEAGIFTDPASVPEGWRDHPFVQASFDKASFDKAQDRPFADAPAGGGRSRKSRTAK